VTPRQVGSNKMQVQWEPSPCIKGHRSRLLQSSPSEASTCAPSSLSHSAVASSLQLRSSASQRLALALDGLALRRQLWAVGRWTAVGEGARVAERAATEAEATTARLRAAEAREAAAEAQATEARAVAGALGRELSRAEAERREERLWAGEHLECWADCWRRLEAHAGGLRDEEAAASLRLQEVRAHEEAQVLESLRAEEQLARRGNSEQRAFVGEQRANRELTMEVQELQDRVAENRCRAEESRQLYVHFEELLQCSERSRAKLESRLARRARWREEAEQQIKEMVAYGEGLERRCSQLRRELREARRRHQAGGERAEVLRSALEQEEQLGEILKARVWALEQDRAEFSEQASEERSCRLQDAASSSAVLAGLQREREELCTALRDAKRCGEVAGELAVEAARHELLAAWDRERSQWTEARADLECRACVAREELEAATRAEAAQAQAAASAAVEAKTAAVAALREEEGMRARHEAAMAELAGESEHCRQATAQLDARLAQAQRLQHEMEERLAQAPAAPPPPTLQPASPLRGPSPPTLDSGPPTPQLRELDACAELVERLQAEVRRERAEREASANSLAALRGSYRLLLQRASSCSDGPVAAGPELARAGGAMPMAGAVH